MSPSGREPSLQQARAVADTVLFEGYVLYPYRASSTKNRYRWAFGVLAPRAWSEGPAGSDPWWMQTECLLEAGPGAIVQPRLRLLQMCRRTVEMGTDTQSFCPVESLDLGEQLVLPWDEAVVQEVALGALEVSPSGEEVRIPFSFPGNTETELVRDRSGTVVGRIVRTRRELRGQVRFATEAAGADRPLVRVRVRVENLTPWTAPSAPRDQALSAACLSTHLMLSSVEAPFVSLLDPPRWAREAADTCSNVGLYPVLAGEEGRRDLVLASPIILYDHPQVAPESPGDFYDATEIDGLLVLRTSTLTDDEKRHARATDPRAADVVERAEHLPREVMERLHGAVRELEQVSAAPASWIPGSRVRLRPGRRRTDAQDLFFAGRTATIERVLEDVDGHLCLAVTLDDDPAADLHRWHGRFHYYYPDEVEPLGSAEEAQS